MLVGVSGEVVDEDTLEAGHVAGPCRVEKGSEQAVRVRRLNRLAPLLREVQASSPS